MLYCTSLGIGTHTRGCLCGFRTHTHTFVVCPADVYITRSCHTYSDIYMLKALLKILVHTHDYLHGSLGSFSTVQRDRSCAMAWKRQRRPFAPTRPPRYGAEASVLGACAAALRPPPTPCGRRRLLCCGRWRSKRQTPSSKPKQLGRSLQSRRGDPKSCFEGFAVHLRLHVA